MIDASKLPAVREKQEAEAVASAAEQPKYARAPDGPGYTPGNSARPAATQRNSR
jgi:hypothetical protein